MYIMAKTIMIGNDVYGRLSQMKQGKSYTEVIRSLLNRKEDKTGKGLKECAGLLNKHDHASEQALKESRKAFGQWNRKYA